MAPLTIYLDTSTIVPLFLIDSFVERSRTLLSQSRPLVTSDFASAEFASVVGRRLRTKILTQAEAQDAFSHFDSWAGSMIETVETRPADIRDASAFLRRLDLTLRTPDALNLAIARRLGAELATFDKGMAACAQILGIPVVAI